MEVRELVPFQAAIDADIPAIMTNHILFPELEEEKLPATMSSKILSGILREKLGFKGLILSDNMEMNAVKNNYGVAKSCVLALTAGVDIVLVCHETAEMEASFKEVTVAYEEGRFNISDFDTSVDRILKYKEMAKTFCSDGEECSEDLSYRIEQNAMLMRSTLASKEPGKIPPSLGANPLFVGCLAYRSTIASDEIDTSLSFARWFAHKFDGKSFETPINPNGHEISHIVSRLPPSSSIVLGTYNGHLNQGQIELAKVLYHIAERRGIPFVCLALRNPWDISMLPIRAYGLALWEYTLNSFEAAAAVFRKEYIPSGCIPMLGA
jgi:beta-N-acetylhexosaminidase